MTGAVPREALGAGERVEIDLRRHAKALLGPVATLLGGTFLASYGFFALSTAGETSRAARWVVVLLALALLGWGVLRPVLRWRTTVAVATDRRILLRRGVLRSRGRDVPLYRVSEVSTRRSLLDRLLGCGTVVVTVVGEPAAGSAWERLVFPDVARVERAQREMYRLVEAEDLRRRRSAAMARDPVTAGAGSTAAAAAPTVPQAGGTATGAGRRWPKRR